MVWSALNELPRSHGPDNVGRPNATDQTTSTTTSHFTQCVSAMFITAVFALCMITDDPDASPHTIPTQLTEAASEPIHSCSSLAGALRPAFCMAFSSCPQVVPSKERHLQSRRKNASFTSCLLLSKALSMSVVWMLRYVHTARQSRPTFGQTWALRWASVGWDCKKAAWGRDEMECGGTTHDTPVCTLVPCAYTTNDSDAGSRGIN